MNPFRQQDLVPLWDRPPDFLPLHPPAASHRWRYTDVRADLHRVAEQLDKEASDRRVALLANPQLAGAAATDGLHGGLQLLLDGESAAPHRHSPSALRIGLEGAGIMTMVDDEELPLGPLDVVLNPSGTWHGHVERGRGGGLWLDVVDLPLVAALGGVFFEPTVAHQTSSLLDPPSVPTTVRYGWHDTETKLDNAPSVDGIQTVGFGDGSVMPTMAVTAHAVDAAATLQLPASAGGSIVLIGRGTFTADDASLDEFDVVGLRSWTSYSLRAGNQGGIVFVVDTSPALRALGLYREEPRP
ncbi:MAG: cupin domain-containing protein [Acidimicrobiales bacterium]